MGRTHATAKTTAPAPAPTTPGFDAGSLVARLRTTFATGRTRPLEWRLRQLDALLAMMDEREREITDALRADLGKPALEAYTAEIAVTVKDARHVREALPGWLAPEVVPTSLVAQPGKSQIVHEPLGVVLVIAPWNYPFHLAMAPMIGAIAGGNCVVLKPSEVAPQTSALLASLVPEYLDPDAIVVVEGAVPETTALLEQRFDHIFYTGNGTVARVIMAAAAKHLTPVTLELGGKSPVYVDASADVKLAAKRIAWGKFYNAGQTCIAPDYVLAHERVHDALLEELPRVIRSFYGDDPQRSPDFGRIVNVRHHRRLVTLLRGTEIVVGGTHDEADRYLAPTVLAHVDPGAPVMADEIFGPILPVLRVGTCDDAIRFVNDRPKPLALYVFTRDESIADAFVARTSSGGVVVNGTILHVAVPELPFGGVGESGMGAYHGRRSFDTFTHAKAVLHKATWLDPPIMYPPYTKAKAACVRKLV